MFSDLIDELHFSYYATIVPSTHHLLLLLTPSPHPPFLFCWQLSHLPLPPLQHVTAPRFTTSRCTHSYPQSSNLGKIRPRSSDSAAIIALRGAGHASSRHFIDQPRIFLESIARHVAWFHLVSVGIGYKSSCVIGVSI